MAKRLRARFILCVMAVSLLLLIAALLFVYLFVANVLHENGTTAETLRTFRLALLCVGGFSAAAIFLVCFFLSGQVVKPVANSLMQQRQLIADISHELKTPLAIISAGTDILQSDPQKTIAEQQKWVGYIQTECERMSSLLTKLLFLARSDERDHTESYEPFSLSDTVYEIALPFESVCYEQARTLSISVEPDLCIRANESDVRLLLSVLLDNACKYTNENGDIRLSLVSESDKAILSVNNTGTPIPQEALPHVFDRFYRADPTRSRETGGSGLGLSIAYKIMTDCGGKITVASDEANGTTFTCVFKHMRKALQTSAEPSR